MVFAVYIVKRNTWTESFI